MSETKLIYQKMANILRKFGAVKKDSTNSAQNFKFRGIDALINAAHTILAEEGVFITTDILSRNSEVKEVTRGNGKIGVDKSVELLVKYTFYAEDGSNVSSIIASEGIDSGDKATNKALSGALKYALIQTFQVPTIDMEDSDRDSIERSPVKTNTTSAAVSPSTDNKSITPVVSAPVVSSGFRRKVSNVATNNA